MTYEAGPGTIEIVRGSVTEQAVDAIVNAANTSMRGGGGIDGRIHREAGPDLMRELQEVARHGAKCSVPVITAAYRLPQKHVIHVAGPFWVGGWRGEADLLAASYANSLAAADKLAVASVAFCSISTGVYHFPIAQAASIALKSARGYLTGHPGTNLRRIVFALYGEGEFAAFRDAAQQLFQPSGISPSA